MAAGVLFGCYFGLYAAAILRQDGPYPFGDFFALWSYGKVLVAEPAAVLYDSASLIARQVALGMASTQSNPFPYPPIIMPVLWPLGWLTYTAAYAAFMAPTFSLYVLAVGAGTPPPRLPLVLFAIVAPTTILTLVAGQGGFLAAALFLGGMRLVPSRPVLGGVLLGLLAYKPQLGVLVPVALLAAGQWRAIAAAVATVAMLAVATSAAFGWHIWLDWFGYLPAYADQFERESTQSDPLMPTLTAALRALHVAPGIARPAQAALALAAAVWVWRECRHGLTRGAVLALATGTFLATPHAFIYDLPLLTGAVLLFIDHRLRASDGLSTGEVCALTLALIFPALMVHAGGTVPIGVACLAVLAVVLIRQHAVADRTHG
jgi:hypothetical protein